MPIRTLGEYAANIEPFAVYTDVTGHGTDQARDYVLLGIAEETGEVAGKYKKAIRDDGGILTPSRLEDIKLEQGDVLWYFVRAVVEHGPVGEETVWASDLVLPPFTTLTQAEPGQSWRLAQRAAILTDFRDVDQVLRLLSKLRLAAALHGWTLQEVAEANVAKLSSRAQRGVLQGSGDHR